MFQVETNGRKEQGERDGERHNERTTRISEKEKQNNDNQEDSFAKVVQNSVRSEVKQVASVDEGNDFDTLRQNLVVQFFHFLMDTVQRGLSIRAFLQRGDPRNDIVVVDDLPVWQMRGPAKPAQPNLRTLVDDGNILHPDRGTALGGEDCVSDVLNVFDQANLANVDLLLTLLNEAASRICIVIRELLLNLA